MRSGAGGIYELNKMLEIAKSDYNNILAERQEEEEDNHMLKQKVEMQEEEIGEMKRQLQEWEKKWQMKDGARGEITIQHANLLEEF